MFGSLKQFIQFQPPHFKPHVYISQNQQDEFQKKNQVHKRRANSNIHQYQPSDKSYLLARFNLRNQTNKKNTSYHLNQSKIYRTESQRKPLNDHISFFGKNQITKDYIAKLELKRKHTLLRAIIRTNQNDNQNQGISDYDQSFKRLYEKFQSIYAKPIIQCRNFVVKQRDHQLPSHNINQISNKTGKTLNKQKRIQYQNCLSWAKKHNKKGDFYSQKLGKHQKQKNQERMNMGHSMMAQVQKKLKTLNLSSRLD